MRPLQPISHPPPRVRGRRLVCFLVHLLIAASAAVPLHAQDIRPSEPDGSAPYVLHLYARLVELPTIILIPGDKPRTLDAQQINIKLTSTQTNSTRSFHPASVRLQGNDPLSIAILLDVSGDQAKLLASLQKDFSAWVTQSLRPQDRVSIYALDCSLVAASEDVAANPAVLQSGLDLALSSPLPHGNATRPACGNSIALSDSMHSVMRKLSHLAGRHILLVVTGGRNGKTDINWRNLSSAANLDSVTAFVLSERGPMESQTMRDLYNFTQQSGGLMFSPPTPGDVPLALSRFISLLRGRYILQFPMPPDKTSAHYSVFITVPKFNAAILPSGITVVHSNPPDDDPASELPSVAQPPHSKAQPATPPAATPNR